MKPWKRHVHMLFAPSHNQVVYQPLGVIGIMVPWNYPVQLALLPLMTALAAGNRAMVKTSEFTPSFSAVFAQRVAQHFAADEIAVVQGDATIAAAFSALPFDHLQ